jgi:crotonobetainyl-CoA:carnitine CoA-transferase CaiB-like acyl-CoA transferase
VVVENFRPGVMAKLGLDYEGLAAESPGLVFCSITGFGGSGAGAELPGYDLLVQALGGLMSITGEPEGEPLKVGVALVDVIAGLYAAVGILAALEHRRESGEGQLVEVDLLSALLAGLVNQSSAYTVAGVVPGRMGNRHPSIAPYELLRCGEGELVLAVGNDRQFRDLCEVLGEPALAADERFTTNPARVENRDELRPLLETALATRTAEEWVKQLRTRRVPAGVVNDIAAAFEFAEQIGLDPVVDIPRENAAPVRLPRSPIKLSKTPASYRLPPPQLP